MELNLKNIFIEEPIPLLLSPLEDDEQFQFLAENPPMEIKARDETTTELLENEEEENGGGGQIGRSNNK